jgi:predicted 3-demethylubiquinone-9 3-methyltransferase (glyoxalase superfamily)
MLWFDGQAEEAAQFYTAIFKNSKITATARYPEGSPAPGTVMTVAFELDGQEFTALNAGPLFKFNEAISFVVHCETQSEVDEYWNKLLEGGTESQCGWLKDKFGVSWQITPDILIEMLQDEDAGKAKRVMKAMLGMRKLDIGGLKRAYEQQ